MGRELLVRFGAVRHVERNRQADAVGHGNPILHIERHSQSLHRAARQGMASMPEIIPNRTYRTEEKRERLSMEAQMIGSQNFRLQTVKKLPRFSSNARPPLRSG